MKKNTKKIISYCVFLIAVILGFLLVLLWSAFGVPPSYIRDDGGCIRFSTNGESKTDSKYKNYRFEKCMRYGGLGVNVSMYDEINNERVFSKTMIIGFDDIGFISGSVIKCVTRDDSNSGYFETCDIPMSYRNWYRAYREFSVTTPRYYLNPPHHRDQK